jgi:hypothetical protein
MEPGGLRELRVMKERSITTALTTDHHFETSGVRPAPQVSSTVIVEFFPTSSGR